jgi:hypothetical protein
MKYIAVDKTTSIVKGFGEDLLKCENFIVKNHYWDFVADPNLEFKEAKHECVYCQTCSAFAWVDSFLILGWKVTETVRQCGSCNPKNKAAKDRAR